MYFFMISKVLRNVHIEESGWRVAKMMSSITHRQKQEAGFTGKGICMK